MRKRNVLRKILAAVLAIGVLLAVQQLLVPKYVDDIIEGAFIKEYYQEEDKSFDVIFVGDCEVYENFSPVTLWNTYGIHSYIRGSAEQYIMQSYYLVEDTFRDHIPKAVVFNVQSLQYNEARSEAYNRMTLEGMRWNSPKVKSIYASMTEGESFIEYVFPLLRYHSRWNQLTKADFQYYFSKPTVSFNGYYMRVDTKAAENVPTGKPLQDYSFGDNAWSYLDKMRELCEENGVSLILIKAPSLYPYWYEEWDAQVKAYAEKYQLAYINFLEVKDEIGLDYSKDTYDGGLHMNLTGAEKLTRYFGEYLAKTLQLPNRQKEENLASIWATKTKAYEEAIQAQCEKYGISSLDRTPSQTDIWFKPVE